MALPAGSQTGARETAQLVKAVQLVSKIVLPDSPYAGFTIHALSISGQKR